MVGNRGPDEDVFGQTQPRVMTPATLISESGSLSAMPSP